MNEDDERVREFDDLPTVREELPPVKPTEVFREPVTSPHFSSEYLAGREKGFTDGIDAAIVALRIQLLKAGCTLDEVVHIALRVKTDALDLG